MPRDAGEIQEQVRLPAVARSGPERVPTWKKAPDPTHPTEPPSPLHGYGVQSRVKGVSRVQGRLATRRRRYTGKQSERYDNQGHGSRNSRPAPDNCSIDDVLCQLYVVQAVARGDADVAAGRTVSHEQVDADLRRKWLLGAGRQSGLNRPARPSMTSSPT